VVFSLGQRFFDRLAGNIGAFGGLFLGLATQLGLVFITYSLRHRGSPIVELFYKELATSRAVARHLEVGRCHAPSKLTPDFFRRWRRFRIARTTFQVGAHHMFGRVGKGSHDNLRFPVSADSSATQLLEL
jgi:hypothetical protein